MTHTMFTTLERNDRLVQLWKDLLADPVAPDPATWQGRSGGSRFGSNEGSAFPLALDRERLSLLSLEPLPFTGTLKAEPPGRRWMVDLAAWFHSLVELEGAGPATGEAIYGEGALPGMSVEAADEETLSSPSPFRWEPKPAWTSAPVRSTPPYIDRADPLLFPPRPKIPARPLHKRPLFLRIFFYLRRWLGKSH